MSHLCVPCSEIGIELPASEKGIKTPYWTANQVLEGSDGSFYLDRNSIGSFSIVSRRSFQNSTLPWTLRDAVSITRQLGLRFLLVDSVFILQDPYSEQRTEMAKMSRIYKNSFVTIVAGSSKSCKDGFLEDRLSQHPTLVPGSKAKAVEPNIPSIYNTSVLVLSYRCPDGTPGSLFLTRDTGRSFSESEEPIYRRAWALQERLLAPRVLFYASDRLVFRCQKKYIMTGMIQSMPHDVHPERLDSVFFSPSPPPISTFEDGSMYLFKSWWSIVEPYSRCELTVASDKLPGLSGLAEEYHRLTGDQYIAGLWLSALPGALMWHALGVVDNTSRVLEYRAPSWSWASMNGWIEMSQVERTEDIQILTCHTALKSRRAPFGEVKEGVVTLKGRLMKARKYKDGRYSVDVSWWPERHPDADSNPWAVYERPRSESEAFGSVDFDTSEDKESVSEL